MRVLRQMCYREGTNVPSILALFRAINVGGQTIKMDDLRAIHTSLGFRDVATYIQTGNVVFTTDIEDRVLLVKQLEGAIEERYGFHSDVILRTGEDLRAIVNDGPFHGEPEKDPKHIVVTFLRDRPDEQSLVALRQASLGPEEIALIGNELHLYYPIDIGHSKLTITLIEKKLKTVGTARNWNTVMKLLAMLPPA